jgi:uncharacterized membrane protein
MISPDAAHRLCRDDSAEYLDLLRRAVRRLFVVYLMLLSLVPVFNRHVARQFMFSAAVNCVEMVLIVGYLSQWPIVMTLVVWPLRDAFSLYEPGAAVSAGSMGWCVRARCSTL